MLKQYPANGAEHTSPGNRAPAHIRINWLSLTGIFCNSHGAMPPLFVRHQKVHRRAAKGATQYSGENTLQ